MTLRAVVTLDVDVEADSPEEAVRLVEQQRHKKDAAICLACATKYEADDLVNGGAQ